MELSQIQNLKDGWNGYGTPAPNATSIDNASKILSDLKMEPSSLLPSIEQGILIQYEIGRHTLFIECYNDGEIAYVFARDGKTQLVGNL